MSGYTVVAERLNFLRFISHFRSIHRGQVCSLMRPIPCRCCRCAAPCGNTQAPSAGRRSASCVFVRFQFFAEMKTTECRRLMGDVWGFLCPVHTPDGSPCGLRPSRPLPCTRMHTRAVPRTHTSFPTPFCAQRQKCPTRANVTFGRAPQPPRVAVPCSDAHAQTVGASGGRRMLGAGDGADVPARDLEGRVPPGAA